VTSDNKLGEEGMHRHHSDENVENATVVVLPDNNAAEKYVPNGDVDVTSSQNGPTGGKPSTSADGVITADKTDKEQKAKKEKPGIVGMLGLVKFFVVIFKQNILRCVNA